jgi:hypothetical protein
LAAIGVEMGRPAVGRKACCDWPERDVLLLAGRRGVIGRNKTSCDRPPWLDVGGRIWYLTASLCWLVSVRQLKGPFLWIDAGVAWGT